MFTKEELRILIAIVTYKMEKIAFTGDLEYITTCGIIKRKLKEELCSQQKK